MAADDATGPDARQVRALFDAVVELPAAERHAHLVQLGVGAVAIASVLALCSAFDLAQSQQLVADVQGAVDEAVEAITWPAGLGQFVPVRRLGGGAMGEVFLALDPRLGRHVAVKVMAPHLRDHRAAVLRFEHEARAAAALEHSGIGKVHEVGRGEDGSPWISMEFVPGVSLAAAIAQRRATGASLRAALQLQPGAFAACRDDVQLAAALAAAVARALDHAHERGVVHRDVKPQNLVVRPDGQPVLLDFGLARFDLAGVSRSGEFLGTPLYASPEQVSRQGLAIDHRTDVYSLGATLYEAVAGRPPFLGDHLAQLLRSIETQSAAPVRNHVPGVAADLEAIVAMALAKEPQHRYRTAGAFADDLEHFVAGRPVQARPLPPWVRWYRWSRRHPAPVAASLCAMLALVAVLVAMLLNSARVRTTAALASSDYAVAQLLLARGDYAVALATIDTARQHGHPDEAALQLLAFEAHEGRGDFSAAARALAAIVTPPREPAMAARVQLVRGDFGCDRVLDPERGLDQVAAAVAGGQLEASDAHYAASLLASDVDSAWRHVQAALDVAPQHRRAGLAAFWLALSRGDVAEVARRHDDFRRRFPNDAVLPLLARGAALSGRSGAAGDGPAVVDAALSRGRGGDSTMAFLDGLELVQDVAMAFAEYQQRRIRGEVVRANWDLGKALVSFQRRRVGVAQALEAPAALAKGIGTSVPPQLVRVWRPLLIDGLIDLLLSMNSAKSRQALGPRLDAASQEHGDGYFDLLRGYLFGLDKDYVAMHRALQLAIERPSLMGLQRHALRIQVTLDAGFAAERVPGMTRAEVLPDLQANVLRLLAYPDLATEEWDQLASTTMLADSFDLANRVVADWRRQAPRTLLVVKAEMDLAYRQGEWERALRCAEEALAIDSKLPWANFVKDELAKWLWR